MFVTQAKYNKLQEKVKQLEASLEEANYYQRMYFRRWGAALEQSEFWHYQYSKLEGKADTNPEQLSQEDIRRLLQLCHPDKHQGKQMAVDMTQKLIKMKK